MKTNAIRMEIKSGLFDHMVVQRNRQDVSEACFSGICATSGPIRATVWCGQRVVKGFASATVIGRSVRGRMQGCLKGLPAGGPYNIELLVGRTKLVVRDVWVGDVWLLGGQSNMQGCGFLPQKRLPIDPQVRAFYMDDRWAVARDPIHNLWACVDQVHVDLCGGVRPAKRPADWGACPGPAFGLAMRRRTGVPQGLIACAHGGTSMSQWDPGLKNDGGKSLYGALCRRLIKNGRRVAGMIWYQGCSDAHAQADSLYTKRMCAFVSALRRDCANQTLPVVIVQIARVIGWGPEGVAPWNSIQDQQRRLPLVIPNLTTVPAVDLPLDDGIHISGEGQKILGGRLAQAMQALRRDRQAGPLPISLKKVTLKTMRGHTVAVADFAHVAGKLWAGSRPSGFAIVNQDGSINPYDIQLGGSRAFIHSVHSMKTMSESALHYGYGLDPYCNIMDEAGRSLPVFGPVCLGVPRAITTFVREFLVSALQPAAGQLHKLAYPSNFRLLKLAKRKFLGNFCDLHYDFKQPGVRDAVVWFVCKIHCPEAMRLALVMGYDGPLKAWVDGRPCFHDPNGVNPANPDKAKAPVKLMAGTHAVALALGTNQGNAWGIYLRFERTDITLKQRYKSAGRFVLPKLMM